MLTSLSYNGKDFSASETIAGIPCSAAQIQNNRKDGKALLPQQDALVIGALHGNPAEPLPDIMSQAFTRMHNKVKHLANIGGTTGTVALLRGGKLHVAAIGDSPAILKIEDDASCYGFQIEFPEKLVSYVKDGTSYTGSIVRQSAQGAGTPRNMEDVTDPATHVIDLEALTRKLFPNPKGKVKRTLVIASDGIYSKGTLSEPVQKALLENQAESLAAEMIEAQRYKRSMWRWKRGFRDHVTVTACDLPEASATPQQGLCMAVFDGHGTKGANGCAQELVQMLREREAAAAVEHGTKWRTQAVTPPIASRKDPEDPKDNPGYSRT
ncbi:MAG: protein phosphatase 2C family protein [Rickettsiales bacterium]|nr:protein phosphatase 2C family protein [Rickettsiales bacterium]